MKPNGGWPCLSWRQGCAKAAKVRHPWRAYPSASWVDCGHPDDALLCYASPYPHAVFGCLDLGSFGIDPLVPTPVGECSERIGPREVSMLKSLCCDTPTRRVRLGWLSFQRKGDISFGLSDAAYVAPQFHAHIGIWNVYNRIRSHFEIVSNPSAAEKVFNPHLTFHAPNYFHFKSHTQPARDASFHGIAEIPLMLSQQPVIEWIRAFSAPISQLKTAGLLRGGRFSSEDLSIHVPGEGLSVQMAVDFVTPGQTQGQVQLTQWVYDWHNVGIRVSMSYSWPHIATVAWAHHY